MLLASGALVAGAFGAIFGSFLNVVAYRLPRRESVVHPRSRCPHCDTQIRAFDNVPMLSWVALRGRCRDCRTPISARYPLVELLTAVLVAAVVLLKPTPVEMLTGVVLVLLLVPVTLIDLDHRIIPNKLMLIGTVAAAALLALHPEHLVEHLIAAVAAGGFLLAAALARPGGMGMGDVKLAAVLGLFLGRSTGPAILVALLAGTLIGALIIARKGAQEGRKTAIPFGPFLALGGLAGFFAGDLVVDWYLSNFF